MAFTPKNAIVNMSIYYNYYRSFRNGVLMSDLPGYEIAPVVPVWPDVPDNTRKTATKR